MKKLISVMLVLMLMAGCLSACGGNDTGNAGATNPPQQTQAQEGNGGATTPEETAAQPENTQAPQGGSGGYTYKTDATNKVYNEGTFDKSAIQAPVLITSFGQSADVSMLDALFKKLDAPIEYTYEPLADAATVANYKTVVIAAGMSSKGLGAAGISEETESTRAQEIVKTIQDNGITVIFTHLGGAARRGAKSDEFSDMVLQMASYLIVVEEGNEQDSKFSNFALNNSVPLTLTHTIADCLIPLNEIFS